MLSQWTIVREIISPKFMVIQVSLTTVTRFDWFSLIAFDLFPLNHQSDSKKNILDGLCIILYILRTVDFLDQREYFLFIVEFIPYIIEKISSGDTKKTYKLRVCIVWEFLLIWHQPQCWAGGPLCRIRLIPSDAHPKHLNISQIIARKMFWIAQSWILSPLHSHCKASYLLLW